MRPRWRLPTGTGERVLNAAHALPDESRMARYTAGSQRWPEEARRSDRTPQSIFVKRHWVFDVFMLKCLQTHGVR
eukprot:890060-Pleurochrysis_carterae.AAC.1